MATPRLDMYSIREVLRLKSEGRSHREIAQVLGKSVGVVGKVASRARSAGLDFAQARERSESELTRLLYSERGAEASGQARPEPDCAFIHRERRRPGVTLELLHLEYLEAHPGGYKYTAFCERYRRWCKARGLSMRQVHRGGEKAFVDYAGQKPRVVCPKTGEVREVELFVGVLGASSYTFAEASETQKLADFIDSHQRMLRFFGGVPRAVVPDQLKSAVTRSCRYEPELSRSYQSFCAHYGTVGLPARPRKPKDKAKVERAVQVAERWVLARLRNETFFSLTELNARIRELLDELNEKGMKTYGDKSRRELFEQLDAPCLSPLPAEPYELVSFKKAKVHIDYHVELGRHFYSVPYRLRGEVVELCFTKSTIEVLHKGERVALHKRTLAAPGRHTTVPEHMPKAHRAHAEWSPSRLLGWAAKMGASVEQVVSHLLTTRPHPEQGYRSCLGVLRLEKRFGKERLEAACALALSLEQPRYRSIETILKLGRDQLASPKFEVPAKTAALQHAHLRGAAYFSETPSAMNTNKQTQTQ